MTNKTPNGRALLRACLVGIVALLALLLVAGEGQPADAAGFTVDSTADVVDASPGDGVCATAGGACTLRAAIMEANALAGADTITLPAGTYTISIAGAGEDANATGDLDITDDLTINGAGAATTIIDGDDIDRVLHVFSGATVEISGMTIQNGFVAGVGGGIANFGTLTLNSSTVSGNTTIFSGPFPGAGGGIYNDGIATLTNSTVSGNTAGVGGGIRNDGGPSTLTLNNSTVSGNTATFSAAGGIFNRRTVILNNSTVSGNAAAGQGGGLFTDFSGTWTIRNTIVAGNSASVRPDCEATLTSQGYNLIQNATGCTINGDTTGNIVGSDPLLGPLANNGGPTQTHALLGGSPAIDAGNPATPGSGGNACEATDQRGVARPQGAACDIGAFELVSDSDGDGVVDADDACPATPGDPERQGCPVGDANTVTLHVVDQAKPKTACPDGKGSCRSPIAGAEVRVFDRNDSAFQTAYGTKNPSGSQYAVVFEAGIGQIADCTTDALGQCTAGEETTGDYLVIVKYFDAETGKTVYTGKPKSPEDFDVTGLASKDFQVIKVLKKDLTVQFSGGKKTVVTGSYLEVVNPDFAIWEDAAAGYVYPFIFTSDSDWTVDLCAQVPGGYAIVGVYDENGDLLTDSSCTQTFVSGQTKVVAYEVIEVGSPEPVLGALLTVEHEGTVTEVDIEVPGERTYVEEPVAQPAQLPTTGAGDSGGGGTPAWPVVAAIAGVTALLLGGIAVWRRRRA